MIRGGPTLRDARVLLWLVVAGIVLGGTLLRLTGCVHAGQGQGVRGQLTLLAELLDPSYELAMSGCIRAEQIVGDREKDGGQSPETTRTSLAAIRVRCDAIRARFDAMLGMLAAAERALDLGDEKTARVHVQEVRQAWQHFEAPSP